MYLNLKQNSIVSIFTVNLIMKIFFTLYNFSLHNMRITNELIKIYMCHCKSIECENILYYNTLVIRIIQKIVIYQKFCDIH